MKYASGSAGSKLVPVALFTGSVFATAVLMWLMSKSNLASRTFDFHVFDTYFIVGWTWLSFPLFLLVTFLLFCSRELTVSHTCAGKLIAMISGALLFLIGSLLIGIDVRIDNPNSGWMALPPGIDAGDLRQLFHYNIKPSILFSQIILLFAMALLGYKWGRARG